MLPCDGKKNHSANSKIVRKFSLKLRSQSREELCLPNPNASTPQPEDLLRRIQVVSPCVTDWEKMTGDDKIRHCPECNLSVYNLSGMSAREAAHVIYGRKGRLCVRFYREVDGTMITQDSSLTRRGSRLAGAALSAAMTVTLAAAQTAPGPASQPLVQMEELKSGVAIHVTDQTGALFPNATIKLIDQSVHKGWDGVTDSSGNLRIMHLPSGSYSITVSGRGFREEVETVTLRERQIANLNVVLRVAPTMGSVVEVTSEMGDVALLTTVNVTPIPFIPIAELPGGSFFMQPPAPKPRSKSIFTRIWHKLGF